MTETVSKPQTVGTVFGPILRQVDLANALTLTGLSLSFIAAIFSIQSNFNAAMICIICTGIIDLFDGFLARRIERTNLQSEIGKHLDSLVDICAFGFVPAIFAYCWGLHDPFSILVLIIYIAANALRLAYFDSAGLAVSGNNEYYTGMPVTYAALFIPFIFTVSFFSSSDVTKIILQGLYFLLAAAMVSGFQVVKLRGIWYGIFPAGAAAVIGVYVWKMMLTNALVLTH